MSARKLIAGAFVAVAVAGCAGDPYTGAGPRENTGTFLGVLGGALIGSQFGGGPGERFAATLAGAAIGGMIGNRIGASLDEEDRRLAYEAHMAALETGQPGAPVVWRNPGSGHYGDIVPGAPYDSRGMKCRPYTHTIHIKGRPEIARGTACRNPDGTWTAVT